MILFSGVRKVVLTEFKVVITALLLRGCVCVCLCVCLCVTRSFLTSRWALCMVAALLILPQLDASDSSSSSNLSLAKVRPNSDLSNSTGQSPHHKGQRSVSSSQKQRRYSDHGKSETIPVVYECVPLCRAWWDRDWLAIRGLVWLRSSNYLGHLVANVG